MPNKPAPLKGTVAVIGAGWAGLACALTLARAGFNPVVFESATEPGGRARRALIEGYYRDNGQHLMLSGCTSLSKLFEAVGIKLPKVSFQYQSGQRHLNLPDISGRLGLALSLLKAKGFSWYERFKLTTALLHLQTNNWCVAKNLSVSDWLNQHQQPPALIDTFWKPLALAILNTPLEQAAMGRLAPVLRDTLAAGSHALKIVQPEKNLSDSIVFPLINSIEQLGGKLKCSKRIIAIDSNGSNFTLTVNNCDTKPQFDHVVLALPPWSLKKLSLPGSIDTNSLALDFDTQPIATVYLGFNNGFRLPTTLLQIDGPTLMDARVWAIDRAHCGEPGVISISISANGPWCNLTADELSEASLAALSASLHTVPVCLWKKAVIVQRATYAATPKGYLASTLLEPFPRLHLAGDWTHPEYPATLEAAVSSGFSAAEKIIRQHS